MTDDRFADKRRIDSTPINLCATDILTRDPRTAPYHPDKQFLMTANEPDLLSLKAQGPIGELIVDLAELAGKGSAQQHPIKHESGATLYYVGAGALPDYDHDLVMHDATDAYLYLGMTPDGKLAVRNGLDWSAETARDGKSFPPEDSAADIVLEEDLIISQHAGLLDALEVIGENPNKFSDRDVRDLSVSAVLNNPELVARLAKVLGHQDSMTGVNDFDESEVW